MILPLFPPRVPVLYSMRIVFCLCFVHLLGRAAGVAADQAPTHLPRSTPEAQGVSSAALLRFVEGAEEKIDALHSVMLVRHGHVVTAGWWAPYAADEPHQMFSLSKSFTSTAVGLAVAEGKLSVDDPVLKFFPDEAPERPTANLRAMRVRDLLTMATGHHAEDLRNFAFSSDENLVKKFLALPVSHKPGLFFVYNTPATYLLSAIVQKVTRVTVLDYLRPRLFDPLGIAGPTWEASKQGVSLGGTGLNIRTEDIARFGQLYLQRGHWQGKQLVPAAWIDSATSRWMSNGSAPTSDWEQGYGFQFWRCRYGVYRGDGAHGQFCIVLPEHDAVLAITAGTRDLQGVLNFVWANLLPALQATSLPADATAHHRLSAKLASLSLRKPVAVATPPRARSLAGQRYVFPVNPHGIESLALQAIPGADGEAAITLQIAGKEERIAVTGGAWRKGMLTTGPMAASGAWTADDTFTLEIVRSGTPFSTRYQMRFSGEEEVVLESGGNLGPPSAKLPAITGRRP